MIGCGNQRATLGCLVHSPGGAYKSSPHTNLGSWAPFSPLRQEHRPSKTPSRADAMSQGFNSGCLCLAILTPSAAPQLPLLYLKMAIWQVLE